MKKQWLQGTKRSQKKLKLYSVHAICYDITNELRHFRKVSVTVEIKRFSGLFSVNKEVKGIRILHSSRV